MNRLRIDKRRRVLTEVTGAIARAIRNPRSEGSPLSGLAPTPPELAQCRHAWGPFVIALAVIALQLVSPAVAVASAPGPPNVEVEVRPPEVILSDRGDEPVTFVPGLITFTYTDGSATQCVIDPALPPNPCSELMTTPGPPNVDITPPSPIIGEAGGLVGFIPGLVLITFADGRQRSCVIDPVLPPSPCREGAR
jgi:hypothetical protein